MEKEKTQELTQPLISFRDLLSNTWKLVKEQFVLYSFLAFLSLIPSIFNNIVFQFEKQGYVDVPFVINIASFVVDFLISSFFILALWYAISSKEKALGFAESLRKSVPFYLSFILLIILVRVILMIGFAFFIIPGIILSVRLTFVSISFVAEKLKGMSALRRSSQLVSGYWWKVMSRMFALSFLMIFVLIGPVILAYFIFGIDIMTSIVVPLLTIALSVVVIPFTMMYIFLLYEDVKKIKDNI